MSDWLRKLKKCTLVNLPSLAERMKLDQFLSIKPKLREEKEEEEEGIYLKFEANRCARIADL